MAPVKKKDIAERAGVTITTVSRVMNDNGYVSADKKKKVLEAAHELGYIIDKKNESSIIAVVLPPDKYDPFTYRMGISLFYELQLLNKNPILLLEIANNQSVPYLVEKAQKLHAEGVIFVHFEGESMKPDVYRLMSSSGYPMVFVDYAVKENTETGHDKYGFQATHLATDYLLQIGHKKIAYIGCNSIRLFEQSRLDGYRGSLAEAGIKADSEIIITKSAISTELGRYAAHELAARKKEFTALVCSSDYYAIGALRAFKEMGKTIPRDVSIIGLHNSGSVYTDPPITTVSFPYEDKAREVVSTLMKQIAPDSAAYPTIELIPTLIHRESTRPLG